MHRSTAIAIALAVVGALVMGRADLNRRLRAAEGEVREHLEGSERFEDFGVLLRVVELAEPGDPAAIRPLPGKPPVVVLREHPLGGMIDTSADPVCLCGPSKSPIVWYTDATSEPLILHGDDLPPNLLVEGAMGAGKSTLLAQWCYQRSVEATGTGGEIGVTAPTGVRMGDVIRAFFELFPHQWFTWKERDQVMTLRNEVRLRFISTHKASRSEGSRIQGFNWIASANDELQDSIEEDSNIEARGRDAPDGNFKRLGTATVKDSPEYRTWKDRSKVAVHEETKELIWHFCRKRGLDSPFVPKSWWARLKGSMTLIDYQRKVECLDLPSDKRVYYAFDRTQNVRPIPLIGGKDVTALELAKWGRGFRYLLGHDPGRIFDVTTILQAWRLKDEIDPVWYVVGEVTTRRSTTQHHVRAVAELLKKRFGAAPQDVHVNGDPHTRGANDDEHPHITVATIWRQHGFHYSPAAYKPGTADPAQVPREARLDMVNTLFCSADGIRRLMLAANDRGDVAAPELLKSLEELEIDDAGKAERGKKDETDRTHWPASMGYGLWAIEYPRIESRRSA